MNKHRIFGVERDRRGEREERGPDREVKRLLLLKRRGREGGPRGSID